MEHQELLSCIPTKIENAFVYKRNEPNGRISFISRMHPEQKELSLNATAIFVYEQCNNERSILNIANNTMHEYNIEDAIRVQSDVINILENFWRLGLIDWLDATPYNYLFTEVISNANFKLLSENEVVKNDKIKGFHCFYDPSINYHVKYSEPFIRQRVFDYSEVFFEAMLENGAMVLISFTPDFARMSMQIGCLYIDDEVSDYETLLTFIEWCKNCYCKLLSNPWGSVFQKVRVHIPSDDIAFSDKISSLGFSLIGELCGEFDNPLRKLRIYEYYFDVL